MSEAALRSCQYLCTNTVLNNQLGVLTSSLQPAVYCLSVSSRPNQPTARHTRFNTIELVKPKYDKRRNKIQRMTTNSSRARTSRLDL